MDAVLNEITRTVHKHDETKSEVDSTCGATYEVKRDQLRITSVPEALADYSADKCGRCFEDGGGY